MSRHLYDIEKIMDTEHGKIALENHQLYNAIMLHREKYSRFNWMDYKTLGRSTLVFLPPEIITKEYKNDYEEMREHMIYGKTLAYDDLMLRLQELIERLRKTSF